MASIALHSASTGLGALTTELDIIANNLANVNTVAFKGSRGNFQDLLYQELSRPGVENEAGDTRPIGLYVGLGTRISGTQLDFRQGPVQITERELDLTIEGPGFFAVEVENDVGEGIAYTRAGNFTLNPDGDLVLATSEGRRLEPPINIPEDATSVSVRSDGTVAVTLAGQTEPTDVGVIELAMFINPTGLEQVGENLYLPTAASGEPDFDLPTAGGRGALLQGALEGSNVDPVTELVNLIKTQRAFEYNSQVIQAADEVLRSVAELSLY